MLCLLDGLYIVSERSAREEELQIEIERLRAWIYKIQNEAVKERSVALIEHMASIALRSSSAAAHTQWGHTEDYARLGRWPARIERVED